MTNLEGIVGETPDSFEIEFKGGRKALFANPRNIPFRVGDFAIVDLDRGTDIGVVIREGQDVSAKTKEKGVRGPILRRATVKDRAHLSELREKEAEAHRICQQCIANQDLCMKLVDVEWQFDGNKIRFYFTSDHRVDFRKLVRDLAATFKTRIEMRQIGVRDEARRLGGYGRCGRYYCCRGVIQDFDPVTLKMVKEQHLAPGSPKISGGCGRLMCCLRYERGFYAEATREFPKIGTKVSLEGGGRGRVVAVDIFHRRVTVSDEEGKTVAVSIEDFRKGAIPAAEAKGSRDVGAPSGGDGFGVAAPDSGGPREGEAAVAKTDRPGGGEAAVAKTDRPSGGEAAGAERAGSREREAARAAHERPRGGESAGAERGESRKDGRAKAGPASPTEGGAPKAGAPGGEKAGAPQRDSKERSGAGKRQPGSRRSRRRGGPRRSRRSRKGKDAK